MNPPGAELSISAKVARLDDEVRTVGLGQRFSFALERDDVGARACDRLGWNKRFDLVLRDKAGRERMAV